MEIILKSEKLKIKKINKQTKAAMFKNLKVGDTIRLSIPVKSAGSNKGTYASYIKIENIMSKECVKKSFNEIERILGLFEYEVVS